MSCNVKLSYGCDLSDNLLSSHSTKVLLLFGGFNLENTKLWLFGVQQLPFGFQQVQKVEHRCVRNFEKFVFRYTRI